MTLVETFIMANQASQFFYVKDHSSKDWYVSFSHKKIVEIIDDKLCNVDIGDSCSFTPMMMNKDDDKVVDHVHATCKDHNEGVYIYEFVIFHKFLYVYLYEIV